MSVTEQDNNTEFIISKIEQVETVEGRNGSLRLAVQGHFFSPVEQIAFLQFGLPDQGLYLAERFSVPDILEQWPDVPDAEAAGFRVQIPLDDQTSPALTLRLIATFADGFEVVGSFLVTVDALSSKDSQEVASIKSVLSIPARSRLLFLPDCKFSDYLIGVAARAALLVEMFNSIGFAVTWGTKELSDYGADETSQVAPGLEMLWGLTYQKLVSFLQKQIKRFDYIWLADPGQLRLVSAICNQFSERPQLVFDPNIELLTVDATLSKEGRNLIGRGATDRTSNKEFPVVCSDWRSTPLVNAQLLELVCMADATIVRNGRLFSLLGTLECRNLTLLPDPETELLKDSSDRYLKRVEHILNTAGRIVKPVAPKLGQCNTNCRLKEEIERRERKQEQGKSQNLLETLEQYDSWPKHNMASKVEGVVDVIIPVFNALRQTKLCIDRVIENSDVEYNLIVINDASTDPAISDYLTQLEKEIQGKGLRQVVIIENSKNSGFAASVNAALMVSQNNVVLLNSDTLVPEQWLSRLFYPMTTDRSIASITPLSNAAEICTLSLDLTESQWKRKDIYKRIDQVLSQIAPSKTIAIPTAVGFCMAMSRSAIEDVGFFDDRIFSTMYGEENDWSMRAGAAGYKNVLLPYLYVYHEDGVSVSARAGEARKDQLRLSNEKIELLYPEYSQLGAEYRELSRRDGLWGPLFRNIVRDKVSSQPGVLIINNRLLGGGSQLFLERYLSSLQKADCRIYILQVDHSDIELITHNDGRKISYSLEWGDLNQRSFNLVLARFNINNIFVNQFFHSHHFLLMSLIANAEVPYDFMVHDYYAACPTINLLNWEDSYCNHETDQHKCTVCLARSYGQANRAIKVPVVNIGEWRNEFKSFLDSARHVLVPSESARKVLEAYYPSKNSRIFVYTPPEYVKLTYDQAFVDQAPLVLGVLGAIGPHKGEAFVYKLYAAIRELELPVKLKVLGYTSNHSEPFVSDDRVIEITGQYPPEQVSDLLNELQIAMVLDLSIWPETYCFTVDEALFSGYPVLSFGLGAAAERIEWCNGGWIVPEVTMDSLLAKIKELLADRKAIVGQAQKLQQRIKQSRRTRQEGKSHPGDGCLRELPYWI